MDNTVFRSEKGANMNTITVAEIKRSGFTALDAALQRGPVQLMKRNRPGAVVLRPDDYERMLRLAARGQADAGNRALALLTDGQTTGNGLDAAAMQVRLAELDGAWSTR
jgi:PHD/YefM family antitoxin component YafN of YafNO toxin-antitoxin module